ILEQPGNFSPLAAPEEATKVEKDTGKKDKESIPANIKGEAIAITFDNRHYRVLGLSKNMAYGVLKVNIRIMIEEKYHVDTIDLYSFRNRTHFIQNAAREIGLDKDIVKQDLGKVLLKLEELQEEQIKKARKPRKKEVIISDRDRRDALDFLKKPNLLNCILQDFERCGVVGETTNKLVGYLACVSRNLTKPLGIIIQSSSAAGKTYLMESILSFIPKEGWKKYSAMTGQSLFYMGETDLKYKILAIVEEEGAERAAYPLKLLQSEGELTIASTGKDPSTGKLVTHVYRIEGPVVIIITTTNIEIDEELQNRCIILTVNEERDQTRAIQTLQRELETLEGHRAQQEWEHIRTVHQNAQRLLRPLIVVNPYARNLTFLDNKTRMRRDHMKYLTLIKSIALLHQYQRPLKTDIYRRKATQYIEVSLDDIEIANKLSSEVLGRSLDELTPQTRRFILLLDEFVSTECARRHMARHDYRFTRREIREYTGWSNNQVHVHLERLVELEYVLVHRGRRGQSFVYELLYDGKGKDGKPFLMGLIDVDQLRKSDV
ncbi:DNA primase, partial [candidate division CSSED10-310 bacterium]